MMKCTEIVVTYNGTTMRLHRCFSNYEQNGIN